MINRVLIRIKVVQLLYSYMLSQSEFKIEAPAENPSRDRKYAHELYMDLLLLVLELSGIEVSQNHSPAFLRTVGNRELLNKNPLAKSLNSLEEIRDMILKNRGSVTVFDDILSSLNTRIPALPAYKTYSKLKQREMKDEVALWISIAKNLFADNTEFIDAARRNPNFTMAGFERGVKAFINTLADYGDTSMLLIQSKNALKDSLGKAYELYMSLLQLSVAITAEQDRRIDNARNKYVPTDEDLNPNLKFVENRFIQALQKNEEFQEYVNDKCLTWENSATMVDALLDKILESDIYRNYMASTEEPTLATDAELWRSLFKEIILPSDELAEALESKSVYWNDDLHIMGTFLMKTIRKFAISEKDGSDVKLLPMYKDTEDELFGPDLFVKAISHANEYRALIDRFVNSARWDSERLAFMDIVIMTTAITELLNYPQIPIVVTLNEYIEIANAYSTPRSGAFINGILYSVIKHLQEEGKLLKK